MAVYARDGYQQSNSYFKEETSIKRIRDKHGQVVKGVWKPGWTMVAPGIETCKEREQAIRVGNRELVKTACLRISRDACPVSIQFQRLFEQTQRQRGLDGDVGVSRLSAAPTVGGGQASMAS